MTTEIELFLDAPESGEAEAALGRAEAFFRSVESRFSRFLPDSELSRLNAEAGGGPVPVSSDLAELVRLGVAAAQRSGGVFDPTILDALEAAGYDRSIDVIRAEGTTVRPIAPGTVSGGWQGLRVKLDDHGPAVIRPAGRRIDLGGIAKGWAADQAAKLLQPLGPYLVSAGGDLRAWGDQPGAGQGKGWLVAVDDPQHPGVDVAWLAVRDGAVATSSVASRRWAGGHHLIDPRTGRPAETDLWSVTAVTATVAVAEVAAKVALILGREKGLGWLAGQPGVEALMVGIDGLCYTTHGLAAYLVENCHE